MADDRPPLTRRDVVDHLRAHDASPSTGPPRVGIEQEWHTYCLVEPDRHLAPEDVLGAVHAGGPLPHGSTVTVEPGGQVELATAPWAPWWSALDALRVDGAALRKALAMAGIGVLGAGADPFRGPTRTLSKPRYDAMEAYFEPWAPAGRHMMNGTASIQINVDHGSADAMARRWQLAHEIGPALSAAFACSPDRTHRSTRLASWWEIDPSRTAPALASGDLGDDWAAYVLAARLMLLHEDDDRCVPVATPISFGAWVDHGLDGRRPTHADLAYHCTTLFPPVRPRGWLELRWLDSLPAGLAETAAAAVIAILLDEEAGDRGCEGLRAGGHRLVGRGHPRAGAPGAGPCRHHRAVRGRRGPGPHGSARHAGRVGRRRPPTAGPPAAAARPTTSRSTCAGAPRWPTSSTRPTEVLPWR